MLLLRTFAPWLLLAFLGQRVSLSSGARSKDRGAEKTVTASSGRAQRSGDKSAATGRGKFSTSDRMQCAWTAGDAGASVRLSVKCENPAARVRGGVTDVSCHYDGKPQRCPGYQSDPKGFWKQVSRAFKRLQGRVCRDERALLKAGMCKRAPRDAHFKLDPQSSVSSAQSGEPEAPKLPQPPRSTTAASASASTSTSTPTTACTKRADHRKRAEQHCSSSWASLCTFFFSMLQSDDC